MIIPYSELNSTLTAEQNAINTAKAQQIIQSNQLRSIGVTHEKGQQSQQAGNESENVD